MRGTRHATWSARVLTLGLTLGVSPLAFAGAEPENHEVAAEGEHHENGEGEGIVNWMSWDYGAAAKDPAHRGWPPPFGSALINFAVFAALLAKLGGKPFASFLRDRHQGIRKELDEASRLRQAALAQLAEYEKKVSGIDQEIDTLLAIIRKDAEAEKARMIAAAEAEAKRLKADAQRQIELEIERARIELRRGVVGAAVAAAEEILKKQVSTDDQRKLAERYVADLEKSAAARPGRSV